MPRLKSALRPATVCCFSAAAELRRAALFMPGGSGQGYWRLFGPDVDETTERKLPGEGKIAGEEYLAYAVGGDGKQNVAMLLQIPSTISQERRCLIATGSSNGGGAVLCAAERDVATNAHLIDGVVAREPRPTSMSGSLRAAT